MRVHINVSSCQVLDAADVLGWMTIRALRSQLRLFRMAATGTALSHLMMSDLIHVISKFV